MISRSCEKTVVAWLWTSLTGVGRLRLALGFSASIKSASTIRISGSESLGAGTQMISVVPAFNSDRFQVYLPSTHESQSKHPAFAAQDTSHGDTGSSPAHCIAD